MPGLFITATDTGAGKTEITAAIARLWRREGRAFALVGDLPPERLRALAARLGAPRG